MDNMITSFNFYYARAGQERAVLRQRLHASDVRQKIGLSRGRVLARVEGADTLPDVIWEIRFEEVAGHHADMAVRAASAEFEAVRAGMRALCRRFERPLFERRGVAASGPAPMMSGYVVTLDWVFCAPDRVSTAAEIIASHAESIAQDARDRVAILRLITPGNDLPDLILQREHAVGARDDTAQAGPVHLGDIDAWPMILDGVAHRVQRSVWNVCEA